MVTTLSGLVGGLLGAVAVAGAARALEVEPWPSATVWAMYLGDGQPEGYETAGLAVHVVYGTLAGGLFVALVGEPGSPTLGAALLWSVGWGLVLAVVAVGLWLRVLIGEVPDPEGLARLAGLHILYGVVLGLVIYAVPGI